ncbi:hypothetical protein BDQ17DRAFT_1422818 [Cyathus striatus]|nr:hypothetical protein BDQ17DRAFT_1422818 [Cyathus striatus]
MKFNAGTASLLIAAGTAGLQVSAYPAYDSQLDARETTNELSLRALYEVKRRADEHADLVGRAYNNLENKLYRRWGKGEYKLPDDVYHREIKPKFISKFKSAKFTKKCGSNPDFFIDDVGGVYPGATNKKVISEGQCTKKNFYDATLGQIIIDYKKSEKERSPSPEPAKAKAKVKRAYFEIDELD